MLKILQISDMHILPAANDSMLGVNTEYYFRKVLELAFAEQGYFDLVLVSGDLAQDPCPASYQRILQVLQEWQTLTICLPGNHDDWGLMQTILNGLTVSCRKYLKLGNWQIICLNSQKPDSPVGELSGEELAFLQQSLDAEPGAPALIAMHHPCIPSGSSWLDSMQISNSAALLELLSRHRQVKAVTFGHVHQELAANLNGLACYSAPATCFQFQPNTAEFSLDDAPPGYRIFELYDDGCLHSACYRLSEPQPELIRNAQAY